jgi:hypothetical protein
MAWALIGVGFLCIVGALVFGGDLALYLIVAALVALFVGLAVAAFTGRS